MTSERTAGTVLTVAPTGNHAKADVPHLPVTGDEVAAAAADCERVGAAVIDLEPRNDTAVAEIVTAVRARTGLLVRLATYARSETLAELLDAGADVLTCPLDAPSDFVDELRERAPGHGAAVHYEARDLQQLEALPPDARHVVLIFAGDRMPGTVPTMAAALERLPSGAGFTAAGVETASLPVLLATLSAGGHVRVGMADTLTYAADMPVRDNPQLVARAAGLAKIAQRPPLSVPDAATAFGLEE